MSKKNIAWLISLAAIVLIGMIATQTYILMKTWDIKDQEFDQSVRIVLRRTAERIAEYQESHLSNDLIKRQSSNVYAVNINSNINASVLEEYLLQEMNAHSMKVDFEYAVYDCNNQDLVYGNYCSLTEEQPPQENRTIAVFNDMDYFFVVSFPTRPSFLLSNMRMAMILSLLSIISVLFFIFMVYIIFRQRRLSEMQRDFINNMTHEFKTPIASIKLASEGLEKYANNKEDTRMTKYTEIIKDQSQLLNLQVEKVLNLAKTNDSRFELNKEKINLSALATELANIENQRSETKVILSDNDSNEDIFIQADRLHLTNILRNLIDNAIKYNRNNNDVKLDINRSNNLVKISVIDQGIGIPQKHKEDVFQKFYRVNTGNVHNVKGFGLGLFYVKNVCKAHGWNISLTSKEDTGTTVTISIKN